MKKSKFPTTLFIIFSLSALVIFGVVNVLTKIDQIPESERAFGRQTDSLPQNNDKYYFNEDYDNEDPLITKKPNLKSMLAGPIITDLDPSQGYEDAPVVIVEFADYECDFCFKQEQALKKLVHQYKYKTRLIWKDYPESNPNSNSYMAAMAARCADEQDMFWPYHDFLFDSNDNLGEETYYEIAEILELDKAVFRECFTSKRPKSLIDDNITEANALNIGGIPFIYINDQEVMGEMGYEELERIIKIELNKSQN